MNRLNVLLLFIMFSCGEKPSVEQSTPIDSQVTTLATEISSGDFTDLHIGASKEEFTDAPGVVKATVGSGNNPSAQGIYKNGKRNGAWVEYHANGLIKSITSYTDGKKEGIHVELNNNGQLTKRMLYHNNLRHGEYKEFNYAMIKESRNYSYDKLEGLVEIFYDNGKKMEEGNYKNGTRDGVSKWYDQNGSVSITYEYKNGELVKK